MASQWKTNHFQKVLNTTNLLSLTQSYETPTEFTYICLGSFWLTVPSYWTHSQEPCSWLEASSKQEKLPKHEQMSRLSSGTKIQARWRLLSTPLISRHWKLLIKYVEILQRVKASREEQRRAEERRAAWISMPYCFPPAWNKEHPLIHQEGGPLLPGEPQGSWRLTMNPGRENLIEQLISRCNFKL